MTDQKKRNSKYFKNALVLLLIFTMIFSSVSGVSANANTEDQQEHFSFVNEGGEFTDVVINRSPGQSNVKVYVDGVLTQESQASLTSQTVNTLIYDLGPNQRLGGNNTTPTTSEMNDFTHTVQHVPVSSETLDIDSPMTPLALVNPEPVDNTGLTPSIYGDGYFLGDYGGFWYAPSVYGYLFRSYNPSTYIGLTHSWTWGNAETFSAIAAYVGLFFVGPVGAVMTVLVFTTNNVLAYAQSAQVETHRFDYSYRVRVGGVIHFTTGRNIDYWKIYNTTTSMTNWIQKKL